MFKTFKPFKQFKSYERRSRSDELDRNRALNFEIVSDFELRISNLNALNGAKRLNVWNGLAFDMSKAVERLERFELRAQC